MRRVPLDYHHPSTSSVRPWKRSWAVLLAIGVGAGVAGLAAVWDSPRAGEAQRGSTQPGIRHIRMALDAFKIETGRYPTSAEGLGALVYRPPGLAGWNGPYIKGLPSDPWGRPYVYHPPKAKGGGYVVLSVGPDGKEGTADDVR